MTAKYFAILTNQGAAKLANATMLGTKLNLTQLAVGDANGTLPTPDPAQTKLINQKRIAPLNLLTVDPDNTSQIIAEQIIPENEGGFWIREIGLYDDDGILIAVANCPETYKPQLQEGSGRTQTIRMILIVSSTSAITLKIDPSVVLATRKYVDDKVIEVKAYADDLIKKHVNADNPHTQYPLIANALKEMADAGLVAEVLKNLDLGDVLHAGKNLYEIAEKGAAHQASARDNLALNAIAAIVGGKNKLPYFADMNTAALADFTAFARTLLSRSDASAVRGDLALNAIAAIVGGTNKLPYFVDINTAELADFTAFARTLLSRSDASAVRGDLGLKSAALREVGVGENQIPDISSFANSPQQNGFMKLPGGLMLQWGLGIGVNGTASVTFNQAFVNRPFFVGFGCKQSTFPSAMQSIIINDEYFDNTAFSARTLMFDGTAIAASPNAFLWYAFGV
ncbi:phage tail protein [Citrobacter freundii]|uniref:phage tail protein n=1 Tax=Citrobacter freundii TaxID=546 RepID=UPI00374F1AE1